MTRWTRSGATTWGQDPIGGAPQRFLQSRMMGLEVRAADKIRDLSKMQAIASRSLGSGGARNSIHPGDLAWWVHHEDPRLAASTTYWLMGDSGFAVLVEGKDINAGRVLFTRQWLRVGFVHV